MYHKRKNRKKNPVGGLGIVLGVAALGAVGYGIYVVTRPKDPTPSDAVNHVAKLIKANPEACSFVGDLGSSHGAKKSDIDKFTAECISSFQQLDLGSPEAAMVKRMVADMLQGIPKNVFVPGAKCLLKTTNIKDAFECIKDWAPYLSTKLQLP